MTPDFSTPLLDGVADAAGAVDGVDRRHVIAVALLDRRAGHQVDAERRARQRELDVVDGERVAREHDVHEALTDQRREVLDAAGVHDDRSGDDGDAAAGALHVAHHLRRCARRCLRRAARTRRRCS